MLGIMSNRPCEAVNVVVNAPAARAPCTAAAAPPSDCISVTEGIVPQIFASPFAVLASAISPMGELGVIGYIAITSFVAWATYAAAALPSIVTILRFIISPIYLKQELKKTYNITTLSKLTRITP